jgi:superfamily I DNA/RNA helicase
MRNSLLYLVLLNIFFAGCESKDEVQSIVDRAIDYHGGEAYNAFEMEFDFRNMHYVVQRDGGAYRYERIQKDSTGAEIRDVLTNSEAYRTINGERQNLPDSTMNKYKNSVNSVAYFMLLPQPLRDPAVNKEYLGKATLRGRTYDKVKVFFNKESGGKDHSDVFVYWFDQEDGSMDYLAYLYHTDDTGMRFREAYNPQRAGGILVQDYINFAPKDSTLAVTEENLLRLDDLYQKDQLKELSRIENRNVMVK